MGLDHLPPQKHRDARVPPRPQAVPRELRQQRSRRGWGLQGAPLPAHLRATRPAPTPQAGPPAPSLPLGSAQEPPTFLLSYRTAGRKGASPSLLGSGVTGPRAHVHGVSPVVAAHWLAGLQAPGSLHPRLHKHLLRGPQAQFLHGWRQECGLLAPRRDGLQTLRLRQVHQTLQKEGLALPRPFLLGPLPGTLQGHEWGCPPGTEAAARS